MKKLKTIFIISIPIFVLHGIEEYLTGFAKIDTWYSWLFQSLISMEADKAVFSTFQIMLWILLIISALLLTTQLHRRLIVIPGVFYIFEFHHIGKALLQGSYYPGLFTSFLFVPLAFFFWKYYFSSQK